MIRNIPINKGNYSLDTKEREKAFDEKRAFGVEKEYLKNRKEGKKFHLKFYVSEYPLLVDLELSTFCDLNCPFCYTISEEFKKKVKPRLMDFKLFKKIIDEISGKVFAIRLSLRGEPMIHPRFIDAVKYAKAKNVKEVSTLTNASKLTPEFFTKAMKAGIDWITVSFDGLYEEYERNRRPLKFNVIYKRLKRIKEIKDESNRVKPVMKVQAVWPAIEKDPSAYYDKISKVSDLVAFNPMIDFNDPAPHKEIRYEDSFSCPQIYQRLVVGADGLAMPCANDERGEHIIGDLNQQTVHSIWHGEELNRMRELHKQRDGFKHVSVCRKC
ncbi:MAG: radical SAM/SPASM domain-containing protein, partial [Candidatus Nealsonbacteria bacterium]|nr:radical SAM/SPASM domain-containing protein [Candidatus Nealsonbacteria bacterium]